MDLSERVRHRRAGTPIPGVRSSANDASSRFKNHTNSYSRTEQIQDQYDSATLDVKMSSQDPASSPKYEYGYERKHKRVDLDVNPGNTRTPYPSPTATRLKDSPPSLLRRIKTSVSSALQSSSLFPLTPPHSPEDGFNTLPLHESLSSSSLLSTSPSPSEKRSKHLGQAHIAHSILSEPQQQHIYTYANDDTPPATPITYISSLHGDEEAGAGADSQVHNHLGIHFLQETDLGSDVQVEADDQVGIAGSRYTFDSDALSESGETYIEMDCGDQGVTWNEEELYEGIGLSREELMQQDNMIEDEEEEETVVRRPFTTRSERDTGKRSESPAPEILDESDWDIQNQITGEEDTNWENYNATLEESRHEWRDFCMGWEHSDGESSKSYAAFLAMHEGHYDPAYDAYYFKKWLKWHRRTEREEQRVEVRKEKAAKALHRTAYFREQSEAEWGKRKNWESNVVTQPASPALEVFAMSDRTLPGPYNTTFGSQSALF